MEGKKLELNFDLNNCESFYKIGIVNDEDLGLKVKKNTEKPVIRYASRGIVLNEKDEIALLFKESKNEYKLIGGGIDENESPQDAFLRECEEELGKNVEIISIIGVIEEHKTQENFKQLSFVFEAKTISDSVQNLTEQEKEEGAKVVWLKKPDALDKLKKCLNNLHGSKYDSIYRTKFIVLRDIKILEYYLNK